MPSVPDPAIPVPRPLGSGLARGVCRALAALGHAVLTEVPLASGRRADVMAVTAAGNILIVEVKSGIEDFRADRKWAEYRAWCDALYFAVPADFPAALIPDDCGMLIADTFGAAMVREIPETPLAAARRKAVLLRFGRLAAARLQRLTDPAGSVPAFTLADLP